MYELKDLPRYSLQEKSGSEGKLYAFFTKPWDKKQTSVYVCEGNDKAKGHQLAPAAIIAHLNKNAPRVSEPQRTNMRAIMPDFILDVHAAKSESTKRLYRLEIRKLCDGIGTEIAEEITWERFRDYMESLRNKFSAKTMYNYAVALSVFYDYLIKKGVKTENWPRQWEKPSEEDFGHNDRVISQEEWGIFYQAAIPRDKKLLNRLWHTGLNPVDYFYMRRAHIIPTQDDYAINKRRQKVKSKKAVINFPLKHCPARADFMEAYHATTNSNDRLFETDYGDLEYRRWTVTTTQRLARLWKSLFTSDPIKLTDIRHTFATDCASGRRFGHMIPEWQLEPWMGWVAGSRMGAKFYINAKNNPQLMIPSHLHVAVSAPLVTTNFQDRVPFT